MLNIQTEVMNIHAQYGTSEMSNYKIQKLFEKYAQQFHERELIKQKQGDKQNSQILRLYDEANNPTQGAEKEPVVIFHKSKV